MMTKRSNYDEKVLKSTVRCIAWSPWAPELQCLEVLSKDAEELGFREGLKEKLGSGRLKPTHLKREGFMTDADMVRDGVWRVDPDPVELRRRLTSLNDATVEPADVPAPFKEYLPSLSLECTSGTGFKLLPSVAGVGLEASESLTVSFEGLTVSSVPCETIKRWITCTDGRAWVPNTQRTGLKWSTKAGSVTSIWVVTGVIYAKKYTIKGRDRLFAEARLDTAMAIPAATGIIPGDTIFSMQKQKDNKLVIKAPRNKPFIVGYRAIRLDLNFDGTACLGFGVKYTGDAFRGADDDDLEQQCLKWMEADLLEVDDEGVRASIPIG